ncbi:hypothetical protein PIB30_007700 [Stylosanthes scabra]|uniref:Uncharacterized protein n=1 Tax=Stylosanthes scabra TaxID=79078 RepID=A0ABU6X6C3_9FABA|nr:hypothetical protein [Stylosanthes scabra]
MLPVWRSRLDRVCVDDFWWTPHGSDDLRFLLLKWIRFGPEIRMWRSLVPIVCFNLVNMHHVDRVMRQLGPDQLVLVNVDVFLTTTVRGEYVSWPTDHTTKAWFLSHDSVLEDPRVQALLGNIRSIPSQPRLDIPLLLDALARRRCRGGGTGRAIRRDRRSQGDASTSQAGPSTKKARPF